MFSYKCSFCLYLCITLHGVDVPWAVEVNHTSETCTILIQIHLRLLLQVLHGGGIPSCPRLSDSEQTVVYWLKCKVVKCKRCAQVGVALDDKVGKVFRTYRLVILCTKQWLLFLLPWIWHLPDVEHNRWRRFCLCMLFEVLICSLSIAIVLFPAYSAWMCWMRWSPFPT